MSFLSNANGGSIAWSPDGTYLLFDTSQRTEEAAGRARRSRAAHAALPRRSVPRSLSPARRAPARRPSRRRARGRRSATARRCAPTRRAARRRRSTEIVFDDIRRRLTLLPVGVDVRSRHHQPGRQDGAAHAARGGAAEPLHLLARRAGRAARRSRASSRRRRASSRTRSSRPTGRRSTTSRTAASARSTSTRAPSRPIAVIGRDRRRLRAREARRLPRRRGAFSPTTSSTPNMNGVDWNAVQRQYEPYVAGAQSTEEFVPPHARHGRRAERVALRRARPELSPQPNVGRLGVRFDRGEYERAGKLRVTEVISAQSRGARRASR